MKYVLKVYSSEEKSFGMLLQIDADATFLQLHELIVESCRYDAAQLASFFTINTKGERLQEISLMELSSDENELNEVVMDVATLREFLGKTVFKMEYQYDFFGDRAFTLEIVEIQKGKQMQPAVIQRKGMPPQQILLDGFEGLDFSLKSENKEIDYEKYLSEFDDCNDGGIDYQSLEDLADEEFE